ncbi:MAG TPA: type II secretion system F family protein [Planctomycetota bacterium]|nr:type II secretion system F family protein [Planctomycetota bacterium]HRR82211.1 type II secretion system F family protein [Planctomycetota bacterium]HRT96358.1 type II secretion system F family protein [Planctomycetota bacterium]
MPTAAQIPVPIIEFAAFGAAALLVAVMADIIQGAWQRYEAEVLKGTEVTLDQIYMNIPAHQLLYVAMILFALVAGLTTLLLGSPVLGLVFGVVAFASPRLLAGYLKRRRDHRFGVQLVDALMNISNALRSGFSLPQAFELIQREMDNPIAQEFRLLNQETRVGVPLEQALEHMLERMPSDDLDLVVTAILVSAEVGGSLAEVMDNISKTIRERHQIEGKVRALTSQGRMQAVILGLVPILLAFVINWLNPGLFEPMVRTWYGWGLFAIIGLLEVLGMLVVRKIVTIDV